MSNASSFSRLLGEYIARNVLEHVNKGRSKPFTSVAQPSAGLAIAIEKAFREGERRSYLANSFDLTLAIIDDKKAQSVLIDCGLAIEAVRSDLLTALNSWSFRRVVGRVQRKLWLLRGGDPWSTCLGTTIGMASVHATLAGQSEYGSLEAIASVWYADSTVPRYLEYRGLRLQWIRSLLAHGFPVAPTEALLGNAAQADEVMIRIHRDPYTPLEFLSELIRDAFDVSNADEVAKAVAAECSATIGPYPRKDALGWIAYARRKAADVSYPVLFTLEQGRRG